MPSKLTTSRLYGIWQDMRQRCNNPKLEKYPLYGGRGIKVCAEWDCEHGFKAFEDWAYANGYREYLTIDRRDSNGDYTPDNCRWATYREQANNTRANHRFATNGETHTISEWVDIWGISRSGARNRIYRAERNPAFNPNMG